MTAYQKRKSAAREYAIEWQAEFTENSYSYEEVATFYDFFLRLARRYGLIREFRENGII